MKATTIVERLFLYLKDRNLTAMAFEKQAGLSNGSMSRIKIRNRPPSGETLQKIKKAFPDLNLNWLIDGEGDMKCTPDLSNSFSHLNDLQIRGEMRSTFITELLTKFQNKELYPKEIVEVLREQVEKLSQSVCVLKIEKMDLEKQLAEKKGQSVNS